MGRELRFTLSESRIYRIARILSFRVFNVFGIALGFTRCPAATVGVSSVDYFFQMLMFRSRPFNPTYSVEGREEVVGQCYRKYAAFSDDPFPFCLNIVKMTRFFLKSQYFSYSITP